MVPFYDSGWKKMILKAVISFNWRKMFRVTSRI